MEQRYCNDGDAHRSFFHTHTRTNKAGEGRKGGGRSTTMERLICDARKASDDMGKLRRNIMDVRQEINMFKQQIEPLPAGRILAAYIKCVCNTKLHKANIGRALRFNAR